MKIAFVVHDFLETVGHGRYCIELARRFSREHEIHIVANTFQESLNFPFRKHFVSAWRKTSLTSVLTFPKNAQRILDAENFDIIHAQGFACHRADIITAHVCNAARHRLDPPKTVFKKIFPHFVIPRETAFYKTSAAIEIIAVSKVIQKELALEYGLNSNLVYHGIDSQKFLPSHHRGNNHWLFAGESAKGLDETIRALAEFADARLTVVSRSDLSKFPRSKRITLRGPVLDMPSIYRDADLFIYPSNYDAFGLVVAEAMATALPVVVGKDIGVAEWIVDGENGFLCDPRNLQSIVTAVQRATNNQIAGQNARATILNYTWDLCAENTMVIYQRAISSKRAKR